MTAENLYKSVLLDHYHRPRNKGDLTGADVVCRGDNPRCGDTVEIGVFFEGESIVRVKFRGRGCSICIASASILTEAVGGKSTEDARELCAAMRELFGKSSDAAAPLDLEGLASLTAVKQYPARHRCVLLSWEALAKAISTR